MKTGWGAYISWRPAHWNDGSYRTLPMFEMDMWTEQVAGFIDMTPAAVEVSLTHAGRYMARVGSPDVVYHTPFTCYCHEYTNNDDWAGSLEPYMYPSMNLRYDLQIYTGDPTTTPPADPGGTTPIPGGETRTITGEAYCMGIVMPDQALNTVQLSGLIWQWQHFPQYSPVRTADTPLVS